MPRWAYFAIAGAVVLLIVVYWTRAWAAFTTDPTALKVTSDPALQRELWKQGTAYGESIQLSR